MPAEPSPAPGSQLVEVIHVEQGGQGAVNAAPDIADYSPQYVRLARRVRARIESGALRSSDRVLATELSAEYGVSGPVACAALSMLAANGYVDRPDRFHHYGVAGRQGPPAQGGA